MTPNWQTATSKVSVVKWKLERIGLPPRHRALVRKTRRSIIQHGLIQVRGYNVDAVGQRMCQGTGYNPGTGGNFQQVPLFHVLKPLRELGRVRLKNQRSQVTVIECRDGSGKCSV